MGLPHVEGDVVFIYAVKVVSIVCVSLLKNLYIKKQYRNNKLKSMCHWLPAYVKSMFKMKERKKVLATLHITGELGMGF